MKPGYVSTAGGSEITITGTQFINYIDGIQCVFGNSSADNFNDATAVPATVVNATTIQCVTPPHLPTSPPFSVSIWYNSLLNPASNGSLTFIFETTPTTNYTFPSNSPSYGGGVVYVYGADFSNTDLYDSLLCRFNENITTAKYYNSSTISCDIPPQPLGLSSFSVSNDNGTSWSPQNVTIAIYGLFSLPLFLPSFLSPSSPPFLSPSLFLSSSLFLLSSSFFFLLLLKLRAHSSILSFPSSLLRFNPSVRPLWKHVSVFFTLSLSLRIASSKA